MSRRGNSHPTHHLATALIAKTHKPCALPYCYGSLSYNLLVPPLQTMFHMYNRSPNNHTCSHINPRRLWSGSFSFVFFLKRQKFYNYCRRSPYNNLLRPCFCWELWHVIIKSGCFSKRSPLESSLPLLPTLSFPYPQALTDSLTLQDYLRNFQEVKVVMRIPLWSLISSCGSFSCWLYLTRERGIILPLTVN